MKWGEYPLQNIQFVPYNLRFCRIDKIKMIDLLATI